MHTIDPWKLAHMTLAASACAQQMYPTDFDKQRSATTELLAIAIEKKRQEDAARAERIKSWLRRIFRRS